MVTHSLKRYSVNVLKKRLPTIISPFFETLIRLICNGKGERNLFLKRRRRGRQVRRYKVHGGSKTRRNGSEDVRES